MLDRLSRPVQMSTTNAHTSWSGQSFLRDIYFIMYIVQGIVS